MKARISWLGVRVALGMRARRALLAVRGCAMMLATVGASAFVMAAGLFSITMWLALFLAGRALIEEGQWEQVFGVSPSVLALLLAWGVPGAAWSLWRAARHGEGAWMVVRWAKAFEGARAGMGERFWRSMAAVSDNEASGMESVALCLGAMRDAMGVSSLGGGAAPAAALCVAWDLPRAAWRGIAALWRKAREKAAKSGGAGGATWRERLVRVLERLSQEGMASEQGAAAERAALGARARTLKDKPKSSPRL